jgi:periplasmic copper chaperone A
MRATPRGAKVAGGYLSIVNMGTEPDRLMSVLSSNDVMTMRPVNAPLEINPGETLESKPGGYHVMFTS